ncbi:MAG: GNAT family N-acetyltransferase [Candidatus Heimdallarchaeota archaeon]
MKIIKMTEKHIPEVCNVLEESFRASRLKRKGKARERRERNPKGFIVYIEKDPDGSFVAIDKRKVVGAIFSHVYGKLGWIGTFGISTEYQEKGLGKQLMLRAIDYLDKEKNVTKLGLETMPDSAVNIGLYSKLGFKPAFHTIRLYRDITIDKKRKEHFEKLIEEKNIQVNFFSHKENKEDAYTRCGWLASKIENGLDYRPELEITDNEKFGETILLEHDGFIIGYAICRTYQRNLNSQDDTMNVRVLVIDPAQKDQELLDILLYACEKFGLENNRVNLRVAGFRVRGSLLRMIKFSEDIKTFDHHNEWIVHCSGYTM